MIENILVYTTTNEIKQIVKVNGVLMLAIRSRPCDAEIDSIVKQELITKDLVNITMSDIMHKLCLYDVSELEHLETDVDDIYHIPKKILMINESYRRYTYDIVTKEFNIGINLGSVILPDRDTVDYKLDYRFSIEHNGSVLFIGCINPNIKVLKYGKVTL